MLRRHDQMTFSIAGLILYRLSGHLIFLFCSAAGFLCMAC